MRFLLIPALILTLSTNVSGQIQLDHSVLGSAGSFWVSTNINCSFTMGESFTSTYDNSLILTSGFQQPYFSTLELHEGINEQFTVYPNPASEWLVIKSNQPIGDCIITDMTGRIVYEFESINLIETIDIHFLAQGKYILINNDNKFPLIKIN